MESFKSSAGKSSKKLVSEYAKSDLTGEIVILMGNSVLDGHHRVIAAIKSNVGLKYVDLDDLDDLDDLG